MNVEEVNNPGYEPAKSSGKKWFACGGIGCVLLVLICGGGIGISMVIGVPFAQTLTEAQSMACENQAVIDALGDPVQPVGGPAQNGDTDPDSYKFGFDIPVSGANANGKIKFTSTWKSMTEWTIDELKVEVEDGETIDVLAEDDFSLDIDDGAMEEEGTADASADEEEPVGAGADG